MGIAVGRWKRALVYASDIATAGLNPDIHKTRSIFGDGAAAIVIEADERGKSGLRETKPFGPGTKGGGSRLREAI